MLAGYKGRTLQDKWGRAGRCSARAPHTPHTTHVKDEEQDDDAAVQIIQRHVAALRLHRPGGGIRQGAVSHGCRACWRMGGGGMQAGRNAARAEFSRQGKLPPKSASSFYRLFPTWEVIQKVMGSTNVSQLHKGMMGNNPKHQQHYSWQFDRTLMQHPRQKRWG